MRNVLENKRYKEKGNLVSVDKFNLRLMAVFYPLWQIKKET